MIKKILVITSTFTLPLVTISCNVSVEGEPKNTEKIDENNSSNILPVENDNFKDPDKDTISKNASVPLIRINTNIIIKKDNKQNDNKESPLIKTIPSIPIVPINKNNKEKEDNNKPISNKPVENQPNLAINEPKKENISYNLSQTFKTSSDALKEIDLYIKNLDKKTIQEQLIENLNQEKEQIINTFTINHNSFKNLNDKDLLNIIPEVKIQAYDSKSNYLKATATLKFKFNKDVFINNLFHFKKDSQMELNYIIDGKIESTIEHNTFIQAAWGVKNIKREQKNWTTFSYVNGNYLTTNKDISTTQNLVVKINKNKLNIATIYDTFEKLKDNLWGYNLLDANDKKLYEKVVYALENNLNYVKVNYATSGLKLELSPSEIANISKITRLIKGDFFGRFYYLKNYDTRHNIISFIYQPFSYDVNINYFKDNTTLQGQVNNWIRDNLEVKVAQAQSTEQKFKLIHDEVLKHVSYGGLSRSEGGDLRGFLIQKVVCQGYAAIINYFSQYFGIPSIYLDGDVNLGSTINTETNKLTDASGRHAWNMVKIDNNWYYVDPTWNDSFIPSGQPHHRWYLLSREDFFKSNEHVRDDASIFLNNLPESNITFNKS
ncbi:transglutaminase domain-containing protein [Mycoplasmopsis alligatoris]|uniref:Transglutaminase-like domain-containing protein n=1 Tax=Mycoplasmopsis alligatoris A21JP2 TaxID=747682 RepID=D4XV86_9BACT|nr:transglutaminase domain-containing protein [Mycoplasmopsis alligatoris]EFF41726.1 hypothetical protein MALL_0063 [Mycoplasmopsis alligatoris A21JP2]